MSFHLTKSTTLKFRRLRMNSKVLLSWPPGLVLRHLLMSPLLLSYLKNGDVSANSVHLTRPLTGPGVIQALYK